MNTSQQVQALCLLLGIAVSYAYPPSYGHFLKSRDQGHQGGELGGRGGGGGGGDGGGYGKKGKEALSVQHAIEEDNHKPSYKFEYTVNDPHTGDLKKQWEHREGGVVKGLYSLVEPDGSLRTVHYEADPKTGFHATVHKTGVNKHPAPIKKAPEPLRASEKDYFSQGGYGGEEDFRL